MMSKPCRPQKCDICLSILSKAHWVDQRKPAKSIDGAQLVLQLFDEHKKSNCKCVPLDIELLLMGSTHFELHRLAYAKLDAEVVKDQQEFIVNLPQKVKTKFNDSQKTSYSRFINYKQTKNFRSLLEYKTLAIDHLKSSIDIWYDYLNYDDKPFNSNLALRLGLTHHVVYACYLFRYHKTIDYQLKCSFLALDLFKKINSVAENAVLHAYYLVLRALVDFNLKEVAKMVLQDAKQNPVYNNENFYESILINCLEIELSIKNDSNSNEAFKQLNKLSIINENDKLQHYYARTQASILLVRYSHYFPHEPRTCFEIFRIYRLLIALMRKCYEDSFQLILMNHEAERNSPKNDKSLLGNHLWLLVAICDFVCQSFVELAQSFIRCGMPECLELFYNTIDLITFRSYNFFWISRVTIIGCSLDLLCDKLVYAEDKSNTIYWCVESTDNMMLRNILLIDSDIYTLNKTIKQDLEITSKQIEQLIKRFHGLIKLYNLELANLNHLRRIEEFRNLSSVAMINLDVDEIFVEYFSEYCLSIFKFKVHFYEKSAERNHQLELLSLSFKTQNFIIKLNELHLILETLLSTIKLNSNDTLIKAIESSDFIIHYTSGVDELETELTKMKITHSSKLVTSKKTRKTKNKTVSTRKLEKHKLKASKQTKFPEKPEVSNTKELKDYLSNLNSLTENDILQAYIYCSGINPDFKLYRIVHEILFAHNLGNRNRDETLLNHFLESIPSNSMRYRWLMLMENSNPLFSKEDDEKDALKLDLFRVLHFSSFSARPISRSIHPELRILQLKYILSEDSSYEHILAASIDADNKTYFVHLKHNLSEWDDLVFNPGKSHDETKGGGTPAVLENKVDEAMNVLLYKTYDARRESKKLLETDFSLMVREIEERLLGPFKFLFIGKILDEIYQSLVTKVSERIKNNLETNCSCKSFECLDRLIECAPFLSRHEFFLVFRSLFEQDMNSQQLTEYYNIWLDMFEEFLNEKCDGLGQSKLSFFNTLTKGQICLILDKSLNLIPWENLPSLRLTRQGFFRVPSMRIFHALSTRIHSSPSISIDFSSTCYILDPANNLPRTRKLFDMKLKSVEHWVGVVGNAPMPSQLEQWFQEKQIYLFIGHGSGLSYYNKLKAGRGLTAIDKINSLAVIMGCSSARMESEGKDLEPFGIGWIFIFKGSPAYVGLLWDVTDTDIDLFFDTLLDEWVFDTQSKIKNSNVPNKLGCLSSAVSRARLSCHHNNLVGSTPIIYGLPIHVN